MKYFYSAEISGIVYYVTCLYAAEISGIVYYVKCCYVIVYSGIVYCDDAKKQKNAPQVFQGFPIIKSARHCGKITIFLKNVRFMGTVSGPAGCLCTYIYTYIYIYVSKFECNYICIHIYI